MDSLTVRRLDKKLLALLLKQTTWNAEGIEPLLRDPDLLVYNSMPWVTFRGRRIEQLICTSKQANFDRPGSYCCLRLYQVTHGAALPPQSLLRYIARKTLGVSHPVVRVLLPLPAEQRQELARAGWSISDSLSRLELPISDERRLAQQAPGRIITRRRAFATQLSEEHRLVRVWHSETGGVTAELAYPSDWLVLYEYQLRVQRILAGPRPLDQREKMLLLDGIYERLYDTQRATLTGSQISQMGAFVMLRYHGQLLGCCWCFRRWDPLGGPDGAGRWVIWLRCPIRVLKVPEIRSIVPYLVDASLGLFGSKTRPVCVRTLAASNARCGTFTEAGFQTVVQVNYATADRIPQ